MRSSKKILALMLAGFTMAFAESCRKDSLYQPPAPHTAQAVTELVANYVTAPPSGLSSPYWKLADFLKVNSQDLSKSNLYGDGMNNMTGTFLGLTSFNNGANPGLTLKAAYDKDNLYILAEWTDPQVNPEFARWFYKGLADPNKAANDTLGWSQQGNCDRFALAFDILNASNTNGSFSDKGCQAACHTNGVASMKTDAGKVDIWNWNLAHSNPLGYVEDMVADQSGLTDDAGTPMWAWNRKGSGARSGPAYEWDGNTQNVTLANGANSILKETFYLFNKSPFKGDPAKGDSIYHITHQPGECYTCHGWHGEGANEIPLNTYGIGGKSRQALIDGMNGEADMGPYTSGLTPADFDNLVAYIKGLSGATPGSFLQTPNGSNADIKVVSNVTAAQVANASDPTKNKHTTYQILITRKLKTNNADDIQFDPTATKSYKFGVAIMNKDGRNHIGSNTETLIFK
jgi:mono/diheme cytochrome c family protein